MQIFVFGDSITYGFWDKEGGWANRLRKYLDERVLTESTPEDLNTQNYVTVYALGIPGEMSTGLLERIRGEYEARVNQDQESVFIFAIGINDTHFNTDADGIGVPVDHYQQNLKQLLTFARGYAEKIVFVGLTPVDEGKTNPIFWAKQNIYKNKEIKKYNEVLENFCRTERVNFVPLFEYLSTENVPDLMEDGIHPNSKGHELISEIVKDYLLVNKII